MYSKEERWNMDLKSVAHEQALLCKWFWRFSEEGGSL